MVKIQVGDKNTNILLGADLNLVLGFVEESGVGSVLYSPTCYTKASDYILHPYHQDIGFIAS